MLQPGHCCFFYLRFIKLTIIFELLLAQVSINIAILRTLLLCLIIIDFTGDI